MAISVGVCCLCQHGLHHCIEHHPGARRGAYHACWVTAQMQGSLPASRTQSSIAVVWMYVDPTPSSTAGRVMKTFREMDKKAHELQPRLAPLSAVLTRALRRTFALAACCGGQEPLQHHLLCGLPLQGHQVKIVKVQHGERVQEAAWQVSSLCTPGLSAIQSKLCGERPSDQAWKSHSDCAREVPTTCTDSRHPRAPACR